MGDEKLLKEIGSRVNAVRKQRRLTQEQVAEMMDVSIQMISNLEQGKKAIRPENLVKISRILQVSTDYLLTGSTHPEDGLGLSSKIQKLPLSQQMILEQLIDSILEQ